MLAGEPRPPRRPRPARAARTHCACYAAAAAHTRLVSTLGISQQVRSTIYLLLWLAARMHPAILPAAGRAPAMGQLLPACTGMSGYFRRGREASGPPLVISKHSPASAKTSSSAPLCPPAPPALGREFRFQKAMMALARAEIPPISDFQSLSGRIHAYSSLSQSVFPGPNPLIPQSPQNPSVFPEGHRQGRWLPGCWLGFGADSACMRMLNRIDRLILLLILGTKRVCARAAARGGGRGLYGGEHA
eukprot:COSAG05_NODE_291_length_12036_cov_15.352266_2_plen_246_part_00